MTADVHEDLANECDVALLAIANDGGKTSKALLSRPAPHLHMQGRKDGQQQMRGS